MEIKNITFIGLNYAPEDSAIGLYSTQWVEYLNKQGFKVSVITAFPYYPHWKINEEYRFKNTFLKEKRGDIKIYRYKQYVPKTPSFIKRIIHLLDFTFGSFINLYKLKKCDLVISVVPFTSSVLLGYIQKRRFKSKLWVHIQDFEFDAALQTGLSSNNKLGFSLLFKLEKWLFSKSDIVSTISQSMLNKLEQKTKSELFYFPNWIDVKSIDPKTHKTHRYLDSKKFKILYSGNIGDKQDWETFVQFCKDLEKDKFHITVVGNGIKKGWLVDQINNLCNVTYFPPVPYDELSDLLCSADLHLLFQKPNVIHTVMPSKVLGMMASANPSVIIGNKESEVKTIMEASIGGYYFTEYNDEIIKKLLRNRNELIEMGNNARKYALQKFSMSTILSSMADKLQEL
jgi:colanic acid biosynthesis glycosyl transferase WcaI